MTHSVQNLQSYREQLARCAQALAVGRNEDVQGDLPSGASLASVKLFTDGNFDKRILKLQDQLELVAEALDDFDDLAQHYVREVPLEAYASGVSDADRFLAWLPGACDVTPEQRDVITCQASRFAVELTARKNRVGHVWFQELWTLAARQGSRWGLEGRLWIHLNPIHVWATFHTHALLDEDETVPACVVFYPVGSEVRTSVLEARAQAFVRLLEECGPCRMKDLAPTGNRRRRQELIELGRDLAESGLAAFG